MTAHPRPDSVRTILIPNQNNAAEHTKTMKPIAITTPKAGMSSRTRSSHKSSGRLRASRQPPGSYDFDFEPLERGAEVLDQVLTDSLQFLLRGQDESQRRTAAMLPLGDKVWEVFRLLNPRPGTKTHRVLTYAILSVIFTDNARTELTSSGHTSLNGTIGAWGRLLRQEALRLQQEMQTLVPEFVVGTAVVPNRARRARERAGRVGSGLRPKLPVKTPTVEPPSLGQALSGQAGYV